MKAILPFFMCPLLLAQDWEVRVEYPFPKGQSLPQTLLAGTGQWLSGSQDTGKGTLVSVERELLTLSPILRFQGGVEYSDLRARGPVEQGAQHLESDLRQRGIGASLHAQFYVPFVGLAGEFGYLQRFHNYRYELPGAASQSKNLSRGWMRVGTRFRLITFPFQFSLAASYQQPLSKDRPVRMESVQDVATYLGAQGSGQEFERMWTFGFILGF